MNLAKFIIIFTALLASLYTKAGYDSSLHYSMGLVNVNVTENASSIKSTDSSVPGSGDAEVASATVSGISGSVSYEEVISHEYTWTRKLVFPLVSSDRSSVYAGLVGFNWYLNGVSSRYIIRLGGSEVKLTPKLRYYIGGSAGLGYVVYNTDSATKNDLFVDLGGHAGGMYTINDRWALVGEFGIGRGTGPIESNINMKILFGASMYL